MYVLFFSAFHFLDYRAFVRKLVSIDFIKVNLYIYIKFLWECECSISYKSSKYLFGEILVGQNFCLAYFSSSTKKHYFSFPNEKLCLLTLTFNIRT